MVLASVIASAAHADPGEPCMDAQAAAHIRDLMVQANDEAFRQHIAQLFDVWMKDFDDGTRAKAGVTNGVIAYERAIAATRDWDPPACN